VAKVIFNGNAYIRVYALFPHPNIFGGFLVFSIIASILYFKMFHVEHFKGNINYVKNTILSIQGLALLLTFSKSAILGLFIGLFYLCVNKCSTWNISSVIAQNKMFHVEHFKRKLILVIGIFILFFLILKPDTYSLLFKSLRERSFYLNVSRGTFLSNPLFGIGAGQFVLNIRNIVNIQSWQYQPVHNVFLLMLNEFGIIILFLFVYFLWKTFFQDKIVPRGTILQEQTNNVQHTRIINVYFKAILLSFIFIMLFDHYFWDIHQGQLMFWLLLGIIASSNREYLF
jgi:hypothetical protein